MTYCDHRDEHRKRCRRAAKGSIGMLAFCFECFADLAGWSLNDPRLRQRVVVELKDGHRRTGRSEWKPFPQKGQP